MNTQAEFDMSGAATSQNDAILEDLTRHIGEWVPMPLLVEISGGYACHSRISDLRKKGHRIENMVDRSSKPYKSYYRLVA